MTALAEHPVPTELDWSALIEVALSMPGSVGDTYNRFYEYSFMNQVLLMMQGISEPVATYNKWTELGRQVRKALTALEVERVAFNTVDGNVQGYSSGRTYALHPMCEDPTRTTLHELGHIVLGHTGGAGMADYLTHRGQAEFQAEAVAYLVLHEVGLADEAARSHSRGYIQGWLREQRPSDTVIREVFTATNTILKAGRS
jgi:hypothetical protein